MLKYGCHKTSDNMDQFPFRGFSKAFVATPYATKNTSKIAIKYSMSWN